MGVPEFPGSLVVRSPGCTAMTQEGGEGRGGEGRRQAGRKKTGVYKESGTK